MSALGSARSSFVRIFGCKCLAIDCSRCCTRLVLFKVLKEAAESESVPSEAAQSEVAQSDFKLAQKQASQCSVRAMNERLTVVFESDIDSFAHAVRLCTDGNRDVELEDAFERRLTAPVGRIGRVGAAARVGEGRARQVIRRAGNFSLDVSSDPLAKSPGEPQLDASRLIANDRDVGLADDDARDGRAG